MNDDFLRKLAQAQRASSPSGPEPPTARPVSTKTDDSASLKELRLLNDTVAPGKLNQHNESLLGEFLRRFPNSRPDTITVSSARQSNVATYNPGNDRINLDPSHATTEAGYITKADTTTQHQTLLHELSHSVQDHTSRPTNNPVPYQRTAADVLRDIQPGTKGRVGAGLYAEEEADVMSNALARVLGAARTPVRDSVAQARGFGRVSSQKAENTLYRQLRQISQ